MSQSSLPRTRPLWVAASLCTVLLMVTVLPLFSLLSSTNAATPDAATTVAAALQSVQRLDTYRYHADIEQITYPGATLANVGRSPRREQLYVEGEVDRRRQRYPYASGNRAALSSRPSRQPN